MCQEPTELLRIGCLTGLMSILKFRFVSIDTKHQLADILNKINFTRDEWNNLLHLVNISHFSSTCCAKNSSLISCPNTMAKRKSEERSVATSKSTAMNLSPHIPTSSSSAKSTAVHLGQDYMENLRFTKNQLLKSVKELFQVTEKLIEDQEEINILTTNDYKELTWRSTSYYVTKLLRLRMPKPMASPTRCSVWEA